MDLQNSRTVKEVARTIGVVPRTIRLWISNGRLQATQVGGHWFISSQEIDRILAIHAETQTESRGRKSA